MSSSLTTPSALKKACERAFLGTCGAEPLGPPFTDGPLGQPAAPGLTISIYLLIIAAMRRKPGSLVPLEVAICIGAADLLRSGTKDFHGYQIAKRLGDIADRRLLTAYGTLYRALGRLEKMGLLRSRWEDPQIAAREQRPGRRLYKLTAEGEAAAQEARRVAAEKSPKRARRRLAPA